MQTCYKVVSGDYTSVVIRGKKYRRFYGIGKVVTAKEETLGLLCFETAELAIAFMSFHQKDDNACRLLEVTGIGTSSYPNSLGVSLTEAGLDKFYRDGCPKSKHEWIPRGTIAFKSVFVDREISKVLPEEE